MEKCIGNEFDKDHCQTEKLGCEGCYYFIEEENTDEQKISKCAKNKSDKTD